MTNIEFWKQYEDKYIQNINLGTNDNVFACWFLVEYEYWYWTKLNIYLIEYFNISKIDNSNT